MSLGGGRRGTRTLAYGFETVALPVELFSSTVRSEYWKMVKESRDVTSSNCFTTLTDRNLVRVPWQWIFEVQYPQQGYHRASPFQLLQEAQPPVTSAVPKRTEGDSPEEWGMTTPSSLLST